jgi:hypothetical protein
MLWLCIYESNDHCADAQIQQIKISWPNLKQMCPLSHPMTL